MAAGPYRTCVGCRNRRPQNEMIRLGRSTGGTVEIGRRAPGRGAYLCGDAACLEAALQRGALGRALRCDGVPERLQHELMRKVTDG